LKLYFLIRGDFVLENLRREKRFISRKKSNKKDTDFEEGGGLLKKGSRALSSGKEKKNCDL